MKLLVCWITVHVGLCFRPLHCTVRQRVVSFHAASLTSMAGSGSVVRHVSKVKCTLICFENTSCTSVFYWKNEGKCRTTTAPQAPAGQGGHDNNNIQDPKAKKQDPKSMSTGQGLTARRPDTKNKVNKQDPKRKVYCGVLRNITCHHCESEVLNLGQEDSDKMLTEPAEENRRYKAEHYYYFKEIGLSLIHYLNNKSWHKASDVCIEQGGSMLPIDNQKKQDAAERLVESSGKKLIFIGVYSSFLRWTYSDSGSRVSYTNWAPREPHLPFFAALDRSSGYKWVTTGQHDTASWICAKRDT